MAFSNVSYTATPGQDTFPITFDYLKQAHVHVYLDEVETGAFSIVGSDVVLDTPAAGGEVVLLQRLTPNTEAGFLVDYQDGQSPTAADQDTNRLQLLYIIQEALDGVTVVEGVLGTSEALPPAEAQHDFLIADAAGEDGWDVKSLAEAKTVLGITGAEVLPPAEAAGDFLVADAAGEDGWDVKSAAQAAAVLDPFITHPPQGEFLPAATEADQFLTSDGAGDDQWTPKTLEETKTLLGIAAGVGGAPSRLEAVHRITGADLRSQGFVQGDTLGVLADFVYFKWVIPDNLDRSAGITVNFLTMRSGSGTNAATIDVEAAALKGGTTGGGSTTELQQGTIPAVGGASSGLLQQWSVEFTSAVVSDVSVQSLVFRCSLNTDPAIDHVFHDGWVDYSLA